MRFWAKAEKVCLLFRCKLTLTYMMTIIRTCTADIIVCQTCVRVHIKQPGLTSLAPVVL